MDLKICLIQLLVFSFVSCNEDSPCRDDWKGDGECDDVNNNAECNYDYGDCCKKDWIGDGECDDRNNFITCITDPNADENKVPGRYDGGDCRPRKCFADENDPLDSEYLLKNAYLLIR